MKRKVSLLPLLLVLVVSGALVGALVLFSVEMPSSVTVRTVGELAVTDLLGNRLTSIEFGEIDPDGACWTTVEVLVRNLSNSELKVNITSTSNIAFYAKANGAWVENTPLAAGAEMKVELMLILEEPAEAGIHNFIVCFTGGT